MEALGIDGAWLLTPRIHRDSRGSFLEWFRGAEFADCVGRGFELAQANWSVSGRGVIRGIHFADVPPGQAKHVACIRGAILDVVVDVRAGSPTFGRWEAARLDDSDRRALFIAEGLGHAFMALTDEATVVYLCSAPYDPAREHGVHPLDRRLGIAWPVEVDAILSPRDAAAPSLEEALRAGLLPAYDECMAYAPRAAAQRANRV